jgi:hypothetical protein
MHVSCQNKRSGQNNISALHYEFIMVADKMVEIIRYPFTQKIVIVCSDSSEYERMLSKTDAAAEEENAKWRDRNLRRVPEVR